MEKTVLRPEASCARGNDKTEKFIGRDARPCRKCGGIAHYVNRLGGVSCQACQPPKQDRDVLGWLTIWAGAWDRTEGPQNATDDEDDRNIVRRQIVTENATQEFTRWISESEAEEIAAMFDRDPATVFAASVLTVAGEVPPPPLKVTDRVNVDLETFGGLMRGEAEISALFRDDAGRWLVNLKMAGRVVATGVSAGRWEGISNGD